VDQKQKLGGIELVVFFFAVVLCGVDGIGDLGEQALAESVKVYATMTRLSLNLSETGDQVTQAFADILEVNIILTTLNLGLYRIGDRRALGIAEKLQ